MLQTRKNPARLPAPGFAFIIDAGASKLPKQDPAKGWLLHLRASDFLAKGKPAVNTTCSRPVSATGSLCREFTEHTIPRKGENREHVSLSVFRPSWCQ